MPPEAALRARLEALIGPLPAPVRAVAEAARHVHLSPGDNLLREGGRWQHLWWMPRGNCRLYYLDDALIWPITPDLAEQPVGFSVEALEPSEVWALPWSPWHAAVSAFAPWLTFERRTLARLLQDKMQREQQFLQWSATQRYQHLVATRPDWARRIPLRHLASFLGITDVALSRIRRRLNPG